MVNPYDDLQHKVVLVTGANGGMGLAVALALAEAGAVIVAADIQEAPHSSLTQLEQCRYVCTDVASEEAVETLLADILTQHGQLDCAVNAAAIEFETQRLDACDTADFDRILSVNLRGLFLCMKYELRAMLANPQGCSIVNLASTTSFQPTTLQPGYGASKHGVLGLTKQAALDYAVDGIRINAIAPGNVDTPMLRNALARRGIDGARAERSMPLGRFGHVQEIANAALWLCSDASSFTTGHTLAVEGGMLIA